MNAAWHARRAKREVRRGGDVRDMRHFLQLKYDFGWWLAFNQGVRFRLEKREP